MTMDHYMCREAVVLHLKYINNFTCMYYQYEVKITFQSTASIDSNL